MTLRYVGSKLPLPKKRLPTPQQLPRMRRPPQGKERVAVLRKVTSLSKETEEARKKRQKIQEFFWNQVGSSEHINLPKLEDAIRREFNSKDDRLVQAQVMLMQNEGRVRVQNKVKVWIKQPNAAY